MPTYVDVHKELRLPGELASEIQAGIREGKTDPASEVKVLNVYFNPDSGRTFCLQEAPDEEAVRKFHRAVGIEVEDLTAVSSLG